MVSKHKGEDMILWCVVEGDSTEYTSRYEVVKAFASESRAKAFEDELTAKAQVSPGFRSYRWYDVVELEADMVKELQIG